VALPPKSGKPILPELGYDLPCEVQGRFSDKYKPSLDTVGGLAERQREAKILLEEYDKAMKALGKRRPKYMEYPRKRYRPLTTKPTKPTDIIYQMPLRSSSRLMKPLRLKLRERLRRPPRKNEISP
jgi:hypothetical protein